MSVSIHLYLQCTVFFQSPNFKRLQIIVNACILLYYMSKVYSFCFLLFYFICSTYVTREQPPGATFPFSRAKVQKINERCNLIPQNIFYRVNFTRSIKGEILVIHNHIILSLLLAQTLNESIRHISNQLKITYSLLCTEKILAIQLSVGQLFCQLL